MKNLIQEHGGFLAGAAVFITATAAQASDFVMIGCNGGWLPSLLRLFGGP